MNAKDGWHNGKRRFKKVGPNLYRDAAHRYYLLVKKGGKQFRRSCRSLKSPLSLLLLAGLLFGPPPCEGDLGDTPEQVKARYGQVIYKFSGGSTFRFRRPHVETDTVDVAFQGGKSQWEAYHHWKSKVLVDIDSTGSFQKSDIDAVLKENAQGLTWHKQTGNPKDEPGDTIWLLSSNDPKTAVAKAVSNNENHSLALWLMSYDFGGQTDATTAAALAKLFPAPVETPAPVESPVPLKAGAFPVLKILGQSQSEANKLLGKPTNHRPIHKPDKLAGGTEIEYPDGTYWTLLTAAAYRDKVRWTEFFFSKTSSIF